MATISKNMSIPAPTKANAGADNPKSTAGLSKNIPFSERKAKIS
jgi:hypothetical protein